jgi:hypothetical protein
VEPHLHSFRCLNKMHKGSVVCVRVNTVPALRVEKSYVPRARRNETCD